MILVTLIDTDRFHWGKYHSWLG